MTKKEWLNRAWKIEMEIRALEAEKERAYSRACGTTQHVTADRVQTSKDNGIDRRFASFADYSMYLDDKIDRLYEVKKEIVDAIAEVENPVYRALLTERYVNLKKWWQIAVDLNYDYYHTRKVLHKKALQALKIPPNTP